MKYRVSVEKDCYVTGTVDVEAETPEQASAKVQEQISNCQLPDINWDEPVELDETVKLTGDVSTFYFEEG